MPLPRIQAFEFNDLGRAHPAVRQLVVESLSRALRWGHMLDGLVAPFRAFLAESGTTEVLDVCAGAGGPAVVLAEALGKDGAAPRLLLTDLFPQVEAWVAARTAHPGVIDFVPTPVDATAVPAELAHGRARAIINAFHHFPPPIASAILADAVASGRGVFISEAFERNPLAFANFAPAGLAAFLAEPLLAREHRVVKAALSWFSPLGLAIGVWDGLVSTLRVYTEGELRRMVAPSGDAFRWVYGNYRYRPFGKGYYFYGVPR